MWFMFLIYLLYVTITPSVRSLSYFGSSLSGVLGNWVWGIVNYRIAILILGIVLPLIGVMCMFHKAKIPVWIALIPGYNLYRFYSMAHCGALFFIRLGLCALIAFVNSEEASNIGFILFVISDLYLYVSLKNAFSRTGWMVVALILFYPLAMLDLGVSSNSVYVG